MKPAVQRQKSEDPLFASYVQLAQGLLGELSGVCLFDCHWRVRGSWGRLNTPLLQKWTGELGWNGIGVRQPVALAHTPGEWTTAIPLEQSDTTLLGVFCVQQSLPILPTHPARHAMDITGRLRPLLECVHRELAAALPVRERVQTLTERTAELEWLFKLTNDLKAGTEDGHAIRQLLAAATDRLGSAMGVCEVPDKRICIEHTPEPDQTGLGSSAWGGRQALHGVWQQTRQHLLNWATRRGSPMVVGSAERSAERIPRCKILSVPIAHEGGRVIGILAFFNPPFAANYLSRHVYLAQHLGMQAATVIDLQYDLMTGLYTRNALEQMLGAAAAAAAAAADGLGRGCIIHVDVDHMHRVNQSHGFEIGNEVLVRIADALSGTALPDDAVAARLTGDRFAVWLPQHDSERGLAIAERMQATVQALKIGPAGHAVQLSVSCGLSDLAGLPQGLERALAAAESACKAAKGRGPGHAQIHRGDAAARGHERERAAAAAVGRLRAALSADRLLLFAQRIAPLLDRALPGAYALSVRLREEDGGSVPARELLRSTRRDPVSAAFDRWAVERALQMLRPHRMLLETREVGMTLRVSDDSLTDDALLRQLSESVGATGIPGGCFTIAFSEAAVNRNLVRAQVMSQRLAECGCRMALHDFTMGKDSLLHLQTLNIAAVRIAPGVSPAGVRSIVELAASLCIETVADCPTADGLQAAQSLGVGYAEGEGVEPAAALEEVLTHLEADESRRLGRLYLEM